MNKEKNRIEIYELITEIRNIKPIENIENIVGQELGKKIKRLLSLIDSKNMREIISFGYKFSKRWNLLKKERDEELSMGRTMHTSISKQYWNYMDVLNLQEKRNERHIKQQRNKTVD